MKRPRRRRTALEAARLRGPMRIVRGLMANPTLKGRAAVHPPMM